MENSPGNIIAQIIYLAPYMFSLCLYAYLIMKVVRPLRDIAASLQGILTKMNDIDERLAEKR